MDDIKREELEKVCKKIHKVWVRVVVVWVINTADTVPTRRRRVQTYAGLP